MIIEGSQIIINFRRLVRHHVTKLIVVLVISWLPVVLGIHHVETVAKLFPLAELPNPYFIPDDALVLYVGTPLVVVSAFILLLSPGLLLAIAFNLADSVERWLLYGFTLSLMIVSVVTALIQAVVSRPVIGYGFIVVVIGCSLASATILIARTWTKNTITWPFDGLHVVSTLARIGVVPVLLLVFLFPKFFWENFNGDGAHAFESARLLLIQPVPFWPKTAGGIASFPGITSMLYAYPTAWFIRLFGPYEVSARLPLLLYLIPLYSAIVLLIQHQRSRVFPQIQRLLVWLPLIIYVIVMAYSATYNPYSADIALPATQDTLLVLCFLGFILAFIERTWFWAVLYALFMYISLPNGLLLLGIWLIAVALIERPFPTRQLAGGGAILIGCLTVGAITPYLLEMFNLPLPGTEYGSSTLLTRLTVLQFTDWSRLAFLIVPCGILPVFSLAAWRWQDRLARSLTIVTLVYFGFFFVQAYVSLHYFVPVMLLPVIILWRNRWVVNQQLTPVIVVATVIFSLIALWLSWPTSARPHTTARLVGGTIVNQTGSYAANNPAAFRQAEILSHLFPYDWNANVPSKTYGGSPLVWNYYAHQPKLPGQEINYVIQWVTVPPPADMQKVAETGDVALYMRNPDVLTAHRALRPATPAGSPIYQLPRGILFRSLPLENGPRIINVADIMTRVKAGMETVLSRGMQ